MSTADSKYTIIVHLQYTDCYQTMIMVYLLSTADS